MFNPFRKEDSALDEAIASAFKDLKTHPANSKEFEAIVNQQTKLYALKPRTVDPNTLVTVAGNIMIGIGVLQFEKTGIITSKIWSFLQKV